MPWETPITDVYGQRLHGMTMGLRTELAIARAVDKGDLDQVNVHPLPVHEQILDAFSSSVSGSSTPTWSTAGSAGSQQTLPFYQEIEFFAAAQYAHAINELELTFVTSPHGVEVVLECDKRGGFLSSGHDALGRYTVSHADVDRVGLGPGRRRLAARDHLHVRQPARLLRVWRLHPRLPDARQGSRPPRPGPGDGWRGGRRGPRRRRWPGRR